MHYARDSESSANDGELVVIGTNGKVAPKVEIVRIADLVQGERTPTIEQDDSALDRGHLYGAEVSVENEYR
jgi:hypothetical protein